MERETLDFDVVFVGAGPANLSGALHLARLVKEDKSLGDIEIAVIEKGSTVGSHILSGAVMDPKALRELIPDFDEHGSSCFICRTSVCESRLAMRHRSTRSPGEWPKPRRADYHASRSQQGERRAALLAQPMDDADHAR